MVGRESGSSHVFAAEQELLCAADVDGDSHLLVGM